MGLKNKKAKKKRTRKQNGALTHFLVNTLPVFSLKLNASTVERKRQMN